MDRKKVFIWIGVFWLVVLLGFIAVKEYTLRNGTEVVLRTEPVDPQDLFRGDYVVLRYRITTLDTNELEGDNNFREGDTVYVALEEREGFAEATGVYYHHPGELAIRGTVKYVWTDRISVEYGIESYFVPEGEGRVIERVPRDNVTVRVAIDERGTAGIKDVLLAGEPVRFD